MGVTYRIKDLPKGVGKTPLLVRENSGWPNSFSRFWMARDRADCEINRLLLALLNEPV